ncbi:MAG: hypothetical protein AABX11_03590 [Nanoarchaeota archaeon]
MDRGQGFNGVNYGVNQDEILFWPSSDDVNLDCLERLLAKAHEEKLSSKDRLKFYRHKRVSSSDEGFPEYENVLEQASVSRLRGVYREVTGHEFDIKDMGGHHSDFVACILVNPRTGEMLVGDIGS